MQRGHLLGQGHLGRVDATGEKRKLLRVAMDVGVAVARIRRHVEIHRRCRLRCLGKARVGSRQGSSAYCADHCVAPRQHGFLRCASSHPFCPALMLAARLSLPHFSLPIRWVLQAGDAARRCRRSHHREVVSIPHWKINILLPPFHPPESDVDLFESSQQDVPHAQESRSKTQQGRGRSAAVRRHCSLRRRRRKTPSKGLTRSPAGAEVYFADLKDGATVPAKLKVYFGLRNMGVAPAGSDRENSGHHHLLIDTRLPPLNQPIPNDFNHLHFGAGQTEAEITLKPGEPRCSCSWGKRTIFPHASGHVATCPRSCRGNARNPHGGRRTDAVACGSRGLFQ